MARYFINPAYLLKHVLTDAGAQFAREGSIQLRQFLIPDVARRLSAALSRATSRAHVIPDQYRCHEPNTLPRLARELQRVLAKTHEIRSIVSTIVQKPVRFRDACVCVYAHGDYTLLHDKNREPPGYDIILDLTPRWDPRSCGYHSYVKDGDELVRVEPSFNTLTIVRRPASVRRFVKYVNHHAGKDKRIVIEARFA